ncbi:DUF4215 domain-containing protein, partial [Candidatus Woesearchaeota archaeon]|nr:DUF4215 domain-containing protein [Candidatus Woesearchaeota archaeon]
LITLLINWTKMAWEKEGFKFKIIFIFLLAIAGLLFFSSNINLVSAACAEPCISITPQSFYFTATQGGADPPKQYLKISEPIIGGVRWDSTVTAHWLNVVPSTGASPAPFTIVDVNVYIAGLAIGNYTGNIYVCDPAYVSSCDPSNPEFYIEGASDTADVALTVTAPPSFCGDGTCNVGENSTTCSQDCQAVPNCGNFVVDSGEQCDDGNLISGDGCSNTCQNEFCGDSVVQTTLGEQCDDGGTVSGDGCSSTCQTELPPPACVLNSSSWDITQTVEGNVVGFRVITTNCVGQTLSFVVREVDAFDFDDPVVVNPANAVVASDGTATGTWTAEWQPEGGLESDPPEYVFRTTVVGTSTDKDSSNQLEVYQQAPLLCANIVTCADYGNQSDCENDICTVANSSVPSTVDCNDPNTSCSCSWNATSSSCGPSFTVTTTNVTTNQTSNIGTCYYTESTSDTCDDDGFLTVDLNAVWVWDPACDASCQANNQASATACQSTTEAFQCPAQIPLPFFGFYNLLAALVLIAVIYLAINLRKRKGKRNR